MKGEMSFLDSAGGAIADVLKIGGILNFFKVFKIDIIQSGLVNEAKTEYKLYFPDGGGTATVTTADVITSTTGQITAGLALAADFCPTLNAAASAVPSGLNLLGMYVTAWCAVFRIGVGAAIAGVLGAYMRHLRTIDQVLKVTRK